MNELEIQLKLFWDLWQRSHKIVVPNIFLFNWESDMISITPRGYIYEYEIKCSKPDFKADFKKQKHQLLSGGGMQYDLQGRVNVTNIVRKSIMIPSRFFYVFPPGLIDYADVPQYAGIITINRYNIEWVRSGPKISQNKATESQYKVIAQSISFRYLRLLQTLKKDDRYTELFPGAADGQAE